MLGYLLIDTFHAGWSIVGLVLIYTNDVHSCKRNFPQSSYTAIFLLSTGSVFAVRALVLATGFVFGKQILDKVEAKEKKFIDITFPVINYSTHSNNNYGIDQENFSFSCPICCCDYQQDEHLAQMPCNPKHIFHSKCIGEWLNNNDLCPLCKANIIHLEFSK